MNPAIVEKFLTRVSPEPNSGCWLWAGTKCNAAGYGVIWAGRAVMAHRFSYELHRGPIPAGLVLDHLCRVTACVNPDHLEPVTHAENMRRGKVFARAPYLVPPAERIRAAEALLKARAQYSPRCPAAVKTHCVNGHALTPENIWPFRGWRECLTCKFASVDALNQRKRAARAESR